ncbi:nephrocystin-1 isoform X2 [Stegostoma tigrinum]|uniref:nephrocystin-1 isoform X2 n=1 Tax=Stegostoma tigrinum TaxID=3053191 RepID=UPI00286FB63B|nr:nephrocystin-1 isoform X2 [Stegostoma tigrinum]
MALRKGPLLSVQLTANKLQSQIDALLKEVKQPEKREKVYERCILLKNSVDETLETLHKLKKTNELSLISNYDQRKRNEERRLKGMSELLQEVARRLNKELAKQKMDETDKKVKSQATVVKRETVKGVDGGGDDEDDDEDEENDDGEEFDGQDGVELFITISDFEAQEEWDLAFKKGEVLRILDQKPDGWWLAENSQGEEGLVPKTYLQVHKQSRKTSPSVAVESSDEDDDDDDDDDEEEDDDDDEENEEELGNKPQHVKQVFEAPSGKSQLHRIAVKKIVSEINATEGLMTMGNIPEGFRASTLAQLLANGNEFHMSYYLQPKLTQSKLYFKDLHWDRVHGGLHPVKTHISHMFTLWSCRMVPLPGSAVQVLSRQVRFCLFDGQKVLSNIHTIRATWQPKNPKTWSFSPRVTGILPSLVDGDCFVRSNFQSPNIGILFELGVTYIRTATGHQGELSCGWAFLQLFTANGDAVPHRTYEIILNGGTPYEKGLEVDPTISKRATFFQHLMVSRKQPKLLVKLRSPTRQMRAILNLLPETLVGPNCYIHLLAFYRQLLADTLHKDRLNMQKADNFSFNHDILQLPRYCEQTCRKPMMWLYMTCTFREWKDFLYTKVSDLICNPVLATFPKLLEQTDILDALRSAWSEKEATLSWPMKRDATFLKNLFVQVYHDSAYPLLHSTMLPANKWTDDEVEISRWKAIANFLQESQEKNGSLYSLLSPEHAYQVFDIAEISYDFLGMGRNAVPVN